MKCAILLSLALSIPLMSETAQGQPLTFSAGTLAGTTKKPPVSSPEYPAKRLSINILDKTVNFHQTSALTVLNPVTEAPGTIVIDTKTRHLYLVQGGGRAVMFKIAVGKIGFSWKGTTEIRMMAKWPAWNPTKALLKRRPELLKHMDPDHPHMEGGLNNPLGARAMYLFNGNKDTLFRIHGTNEPWSIGKPVSSGCFRLLNADAINLYNHVGIGTPVIVR
jgi:lipoprotein-anchoring transpeptidase ErfK/SrfK